MTELREFMFDRVYLSPEQRIHTEPAVALIRRLVDYHLAHPDELPESYRDTEADLTTQVVDYVAGMTDRYAVMVHERLFGELL
jgi:dGTPase